MDAADRFLPSVDHTAQGDGRARRSWRSSSASSAPRPTRLCGRRRARPPRRCARLATSPSRGCPRSRRRWCTTRARATLRTPRTLSWPRRAQSGASHSSPGLRSSSTASANLRGYRPTCAQTGVRAWHCRSSGRTPGAPREGSGRTSWLSSRRHRNASLPRSRTCASFAAAQRCAGATLHRLSMRCGAQTPPSSPARPDGAAVRRAW